MSNSLYTSVLNTKVTPQTAVIPGRESEMKVNNAGGVTFVTDPFVRLERFLILGSDRPTYYVTAQKLTKDNADCILACLKIDGQRTVDFIVAVSEDGRAAKNDPALFALAVCASFGDTKTKAYALAQLSRVARIGTHLFHFASYLDGMRGWGRQVKSAFASWYTDRSVSSLAYQTLKYQNRDGWGNSDLLRLAHPDTSDVAKRSLMAYVVAGNLKALKDKAENWSGRKASPKHEGTSEQEITTRRARYQEAYDFLTGDSGIKLVSAFENAKIATDSAQIVRLITDAGLTREMIPTQFLTEAVVWEALLQKMPLGAMVRNLGNMSKCGLLAPLSAASKLVVSRLNDQEYIHQSRLHPLSILEAERTYSSGHGLKGKGTWDAVGSVSDALEEAFYLAFANVEPTGKNKLIALDVSGSMATPFSAGSNLTSCMVGATLAMVSARREKDYAIYGFAGPEGSNRWDYYGRNTGLVNLGITAHDRLESAMQKAQKSNWGTTDCSMPFQYAEKNKLDVDAFIVITDSETYAGSIQPSQALKRYRGSCGKPDAKLVVVATCSTEFTIADPQDPGMLDVCGMDTSVPTVIDNFIRGKAVSGGVDEY